MRYAFLLAITGIALGGCNKPQDASAAPAATSGQTSTSQAPPAGGSGNTVAPMTTPIGGATPVTGGESVQGGGSGVGQAAKDMARKSAAKASGSRSLDQLGNGGGESGQ